MRENIIAKRYILIDLWLNGSRHGIYFIDEHFDSFLAENNKRPDSVFLRFSAPWKVALEPPPNPTDDSAFFATEVVTYGRYERPSYTNLLAQATSRLNNFRYNKIPVSAVFDEKLFARYFALADVFGAWHGLSFANLRFYFNPITGLIEPVPDDNFNEVVTHVKKDRLTRLTDSYNRGALLKRFLADTSFVSMYIDEVRRFTDPQYLDRFFSSIAPNLEAYVNIIRKDHPLYDFRYRADRGGLIGILKNQGVGKSEVMFHADLIRDTVLSSIAKRLDSTTQAHLGEPIRKPLSSGPCNTKLNRTNLSLANPLIEFQDDRVVIPHGTFHIYKDFVVPDGCYLQVQAGANVVLHNGAYIVSSQRANFVGTAQAPISLRGTPPFGGGLLVLNSPLKSAIRYTHFSALSSGVSTDRFLRGAVTFYRSDVEITNSTFVGNLFGDDFLNIVDSNYSLASCHFDTTFSDAFDSDFSNGVIIDTRYTNIGADKTSGGDALDFSRSQALIQNAHFQTIGDKAISIGESSTVTVIDAVIHDATNGLVTKDGSSAVFTGVNFYGVQRGLVVFRKKPGYPTPMAVGENVSFSDVPLPFLVERNSTLTLDGEDIPYNTLDGKSIIYTRQ
jgi:hypothetical protein